jgi:hypothetical protein
MPVPPASDAERRALGQAWREAQRALNAAWWIGHSTTAQNLADWNAQYEAAAELRRRIGALDS